MLKIPQSTDVGNITSSSTDVINREEINAILPLYRDWGYRTNNGRHERYEEESHSVRIVQYYTDGVMRNLQQIDRDFTWIDTNPYRPVIIDTEELQHAAQSLIERFFSENPERLKLATKFAQHTLTKEDNIGFACMVCCMRSMLCVYRGDFSGAESISDAWFTRQKALYSPYESDTDDDWDM